MKTPRIVPTSLLALAALLCAAMLRPASADMIIDNSGTINTGTRAADASPAGNSSYLAAGFTINAGSKYTLTDAIAYGINSSGPPAGSSGGMTVYATGSLWMGSGSGPMTFVENLTTSVNGTTYTFDDTTGASLIGGETYWLVITGTKKTLIWYTSTATSTGPGATYTGVGQGFLTGSASSPSISSFSADNSGVAGFEIDATSASVPEPSSLALCGLAGVIGATYAWRRRQQTATA
jgi:hypothetical protein